MRGLGCASTAAAAAAAAAAATAFTAAPRVRTHVRTPCTRLPSRPLPTLFVSALLVFVAEQTCAIAADLTTYGANALAGTCGAALNSSAGTLNAVTGDTTCALGCDAGYVVSSSTLTCAANGNAADGTLTGGVTCTGRSLAMLCTRHAQRPPGGPPAEPCGCCALDRRLCRPSPLPTCAPQMCAPHTRPPRRALRPLCSCPPAEQTCAVDTLTTYDPKALSADTDGCVDNATLNAVTGTTTCNLKCAVGYKLGAGGGSVACAPNANLAEGTRTDSVTCTGTPHALPAALARLAAFFPSTARVSSD